MKKIMLGENLEFSRIIQGLWRLSDWNLTKKETLNLIEKCLELGITTFDHADIYGNYTCEKLFGDALSLNPCLRKEIQLVTKCGIKLVSSNRPEHKLKYYDTSEEHIINSVENSLKNLRTEYIDLLLIHRPDPFMNPNEVAAAFNILKTQGKVKNFGVSNFTPSQFNMLSSYLDFPLVTNQIEISPLCYDNFGNGCIDQCLEKRIAPMAWSPLGGGRIFTADDKNSLKIKMTLEKIAKELRASSIEQVMYAWLLAHPANIMPIVGSGKIDRIKSAVQSINLKLSREQWFEILEASRGFEVA